MLHAKGFNTKTFLAFLRGVNTRCHKHPQGIAILVDNSSIHRDSTAPFIKYCDKMDISYLRNVRYRPDFNGVEIVWGWAKKRFRHQMDYLKANNLPWDEMLIVKDVMDSIPTEVAVNAARAGFANIERGKLVKDKRFKEGPHHELKLIDLAGAARPNPALEKQFEKFKAKMAESDS